MISVLWQFIGGAAQPVLRGMVDGKRSLSLQWLGALRLLFFPVCGCLMAASPLKAGSTDNAVQARSNRPVAQDPGQLQDKLFILWEYAGALRERELAKVVLNETADPEMKSLRDDGCYRASARHGHHAPYRH